MRASSRPSGKNAQDEEAARAKEEAQRKQTEQRILRFVDAAQQIILEDGDFSILDVARKSGLSLYTFYRIFNGKDDLILQLLDVSFRRSATDIENKNRRIKDPMKRLNSAIHELTQWVYQPEMQKFRLWLIRNLQRLAIEHPDAMREVFEPYYQLMEREIETGQKIGMFRQEDPRALTTLLLYVLLGCVYGKFMESGSAATTEQIREFCSHALTDSPPVPFTKPPGP